MRTRSYFITSTGTGIGKTLITCALCWQQKQQGKTIGALKPVMSGFSLKDPESDAALILKSQNIVLNQEAIASISPWCFTPAISPHLAAKKAHIELSAAEIVQFCRSKEEGDILLVEGAGGIMAPINEHETMLDIMKALHYPVILVAGSYLGSISHTLTALSVLRSHNLAVEMLIVSASEHPPISLEETIDTLQRFSGNAMPILGIPRLTEKWPYMFLPEIPLKEGL